MDAQSPIEQYDTLITSNAFVFLVCKSFSPFLSLPPPLTSLLLLDYRGHWCPFCMGYLKTLHTLSAQISSAGGKIIVVTAESAEFISETRKVTGYEGLIIVDEKNELAKELKRRGLVDVAISEKKGYENGMAQPAILGKSCFCELGGFSTKKEKSQGGVSCSVMTALIVALLSTDPMLFAL
jgi:hypothetical protein